MCSCEPTPMGWRAPVSSSCFDAHCMQHPQRNLMSTTLTKVSRILAVKSSALIASLCALTIPLWAHEQQISPCANQAPPPGALSLGYVRLVFCETPSVPDIDFSATGMS